jgi:hypothetical protein
VLATTLVPARRIANALSVPEIANREPPPAPVPVPTKAVPAPPTPAPVAAAAPESTPPARVRTRSRRAAPATATAPTDRTSSVPRSAADTRLVDGIRDPFAER